jgi:hypothetical protein
MKRLILSILLIGILISLSGCSNSPKDTLQDSIDEYSQCMIDNDFKCQSKFLDPTPFEEMGSSVSDAMEGLKSSGMKIVDIQMNKPSKISKNGDILSSSISYSMTAKMQGQEIKTDASINAISKDNGSTWLFSSKQ